MMKTVDQLLERKGRAIFSVTSRDVVYTAVEQMAEHGVGALMVINDGQPVGIISERDYARGVILKGKSSKETLVQEIMTRDIIYGSPSLRVDECMALMTSKRIRHLPIKSEAELIGVLSIGDLVKAVIAEQKFMIEQLEIFIRN
ncbi:MAG: CBS domain-containing protein [Bradymonadia bacterium]|jgi:CBS domain-containing protein